jgi:GTP-binding protein Era
LFVVEAGSSRQLTPSVLALLGKNIPTLLIANKLDNIHRRGDIAPWLQDHAGQAHAVCRICAHVGQERQRHERLLGICEKYLPEQAWWYAEDELTDRSEKFLASELVREKLFRLTGDELPYTSTVVIDKFEEEAGRNARAKAPARIAATIVVERDTHKAMVIGDKGERIKRIGMKPASSWKNWPTPRCSSSCGSRCVPAGPMTKRGCAALATNKRSACAGRCVASQTHL